jgi:hypothetical protein
MVSLEISFLLRKHKNSLKRMNKTSSSSHHQIKDDEIDNRMSKREKFEKTIKL